MIRMLIITDTTNNNIHEVLRKDRLEHNLGMDDLLIFNDFNFEMDVKKYIWDRDTAQYYKHAIINSINNMIADDIEYIVVDKGIRKFMDEFIKETSFDIKLLSKQEIKILAEINIL